MIYGALAQTTKTNNEAHNGGRHDESPETSHRVRLDSLGDSHVVLEILGLHGVSPKVGLIGLDVANMLDGVFLPIVMRCCLNFGRHDER